MNQEKIQQFYEAARKALDAMREAARKIAEELKRIFYKAMEAIRVKVLTPTKTYTWDKERLAYVQVRRVNPVTSFRNFKNHRR